MHYRIYGWFPKPVDLTEQATALMFHTLHAVNDPAPDWVFAQFLELVEHNAHVASVTVYV